jgi:putative holliday junction resolvase
MRAAAIDLGTVRVGLAVADELGMLAHPRPYLDGRDIGRVVGQLARLAAEEQITLFVVGLPAHMSGEEGIAARKARAFAKRLAEKTGLEVELIDERWSTKEATQRLRDQGLSAKEQRERIDSASAALLLQSWLDSRKPTE